MSIPALRAFSVKERKVRPQKVSEQHNEEDCESMEKIWEENNEISEKEEARKQSKCLKGYNPFLGLRLCAARARSSNLGQLF